jgi:hypothetical protein
MTLITPNFAQQQAAKLNGGGQPHVVAQHEPLAGAAQWTGTVPTQTATPQTVNIGSWMGPRVAIIGTAPSSRMLAPFNDPTWKIWGCSPGNKDVLPRADAWFEVHGNLLWPECESYGRPYIAWLNQQKFPVFMQDQSVVPAAIPFPKDQLVQEFGPFFFTSSFAWMGAFAILLGAKEVAMYGIDMASREEYIQQRAGGQYLIVEGARRGVKVWAPYESDIMQPPGLYGYSDVTPLGRKTHARELELKQRVAQLDNQLNALQRDRAYLGGALEDVDYFKSIHIGAQDNNTTAAFLGGLMAKHALTAATAIPLSQPAAVPLEPLNPSAMAAASPPNPPSKPRRSRKRPEPTVNPSPAGQG